MDRHRIPRRLHRVADPAPKPAGQHRAHHPPSPLERGADERRAVCSPGFESPFVRVIIIRGSHLVHIRLVVLVPRRALYAPHVHGPLLGARRQELRARFGIVASCVVPRLGAEAQAPNLGVHDASAKGPELRPVREAVHADDGALRGRRGEHGAVAGQRAGGDGRVVATQFAHDVQIDAVVNDDGSMMRVRGEGEEGGVLVGGERADAARVRDGVDGSLDAEGGEVVDHRAALLDDDEPRAVEAHGEDRADEGEVGDAGVVGGVQHLEPAGRQLGGIARADDDEQGGAEEHLDDANRAHAVVVHARAGVAAVDLEPAPGRHREAAPVLVERARQHRLAGLGARISPADALHGSSRSRGRCVGG
mmetsp:Transcript_5341/g.20079  ORF Transcript_5341/g.20079 Transcript_5341/m.20079 type:complete len:363 (-) Transcript_5341:41-1129(-)